MREPVHALLMLISLLAGWSQVVAQSPTSVSGRVVGYLSNRIGDFDGLRLRTASGDVYIHFPPHTAAKVRRLAVVGKLLKADIEPGLARPGLAKPGHPGPEGTTQPARTTYRLIRIRNQTSGAVVQIADLPPPPPQPGKLVQTEGPLVDDMHDETGQLIGLLTDKYVIELKQHQSEQISLLLVGVQRLGVVGYERPTDGFVNRSGRPLLHPTSLTIRGQTFAL